MSSLTSPALVYMSSKAVIAAAPEIALAKDFCHSFENEEVKPGTTMKVPVFDTTPATTYNESTNNYETVNGTVKMAAVTFDQHVKKTYEFTDKDFLEINTSFWGECGEAASISISQAILNVVSNLINKTNIPKEGDGFSAENESVMSSVTKKNMAALRVAARKAGIAPKHTVLALNPVTYAEVLSLLDSHVYNGAEAIRTGRVPGLYGFKSAIELPLSENPEENLIGALIPDNSIAIAGRVVPCESPAQYDEVGVIVDEASGLPLGIRRHGNPKVDKNYLNVEALFGAAFLQAPKIVRIVSGATA